MKIGFTLEGFDELLSGFLRDSGGGGVYFTPNSPNFDLMTTCRTSDKHIIQGGNINCQFIDIDAPKEVRKNELDLGRWKREVKNQILDFDLRPSMVVDTKNGYHVYWLLENGEHRLFRHVQMQLMQYFNGDPACINESRLLRLPGFQHRKNLKKPYGITTKIFEPQNRYTQQELSAALPELKENTLKKVAQSKANDENTIEGGNDRSPTIEISDARRRAVLELLLLKVDYVNEYDNKFTMNCCLPDHPDKNPSAWLDTEYMWYHCSGCKSHYAIDELAEEMGWKDVLEAWNTYNVDIDSELNRIKKQSVSINELEHLALKPYEQLWVNNVTLKVIESFDAIGQDINKKHKQYIHEIVQILYKGNQDKPYLLPLDMGGGKSLIISIFLQVALKDIENFGAIVSVERRKDVKRIAEKLNDEIGTDVAYPMYGFSEYDCFLNTIEGKENDHCIARKTYNKR